MHPPNICIAVVQLLVFLRLPWLVRVLKSLLSVWLDILSAAVVCCLLFCFNMLAFLGVLFLKMLIWFVCSGDALVGAFCCPQDVWMRRINGRRGCVTHHRFWRMLFKSLCVCVCVCLVCSWQCSVPVGPVVHLVHPIRAPFPPQRAMWRGFGEARCPTIAGSDYPW